MAYKKVSKDYNLELLFPDIAKKWDYKKNDLKPNEVTPHSGKKVWWLCDKNHSFSKTVDAMNGNQPNCPFCVNQKVGYGNDLETNFPEIAKQWDYKKNDLKPNEVLPFSHKKVWWLCPEKHSYQQTIAAKNKLNQECSYCTNQKAGYGNDLQTNYPELVSEWDFKRNIKKPNEILPGTDFKAYWICSNGHNYKMRVANRTRDLYPLGCSKCVLHSKSREEIYLLFELKHFFNIDPDDNKVSFDKNLSVDIKFKNYKIIVEFDGHYWHKGKDDKDLYKTKQLQKYGWTVIRVREGNLKLISKEFDVKANRGMYKQTANRVLKKLNQIGYDIPNLDKYLNRKTLINKLEADKYINSYKLIKK